MRILVMGTGGLGGYFGGLLAHSGADVTFIAPGANLQAWQARGLTVRSVHGNFTMPVHTCETPQGLPPADVVLFCVKTYAVAEAAGVAMDPDIVVQTLAYLDTQEDLGESSIAVDLQRRRPIEVDAIHGAVVRHGQRLHVPTSVNATIHAALMVMDQVQRQVSSASPGCTP